MAKRTSSPWPTWVRWLALFAGLLVSAIIGYFAVLVVTLGAVLAGAAPLGLVGETTPRQSWVIPVSLAVGLIIFGFCVRLSVSVLRRHSGGLSVADERK